MYMFVATSILCIFSVAILAKARHLYTLLPRPCRWLQLLLLPGPASQWLMGHRKVYFNDLQLAAQAVTILFGQGPVLGMPK